MEQPPPLTPQDIAALQNTQYAELSQPQTVKVFGILHLVLGAYGVVMLIFAIVAMAGINPFLALMPKTAAVSAQMEQQAAMQAKLLPVNILTTLMTLIITILILLAGINLLKRRRSGLTWSNRYAWTSLAAKVLSVLIVGFFTYPMMQEMMGKSSTVFGSGLMLGGMIFGAAIPAVYPILTLILLNRPKTKEWFANRPE